MKFLFSLLATLFFALPAWAVDVQMGANGQLVFEPSEVSISAGDSIHFVNNMLPPHNVVVDGHPELSHTGLAFAPGESFDISFDTAFVFQGLRKASNHHVQAMSCLVSSSKSSADSSI